VRQLRAAILRAEQKLSLRNESGARFDAKISPPANARAANQLSLIRSFLIDSGRREPFCEANCEKNFGLCRCQSNARCHYKIACACIRFLLLSRADNEIALLQKALISSGFLRCRRNTFDNARRVGRVRHRDVFALR